MFAGAAFALLSSVVAAGPQPVPRALNLPSWIEENVGQSSAPARFISRGRAYRAHLAPTVTRLFLEHRPTGATSKSPATAIVDLRLTGARADATMTGEEELPTKVAYYRGRDPERWRSHIRTFGRVRTTGVYPGVDVLQHASGRDLELDFAVAPRADVRRIGFALEGAGSVKLDRGSIVVRTRAGELRLPPPAILERRGGRERRLVGRYVRRARGDFGIEVPGRDPEAELLIDPVLDYSTYLGGAGYDEVLGVAATASGAVFAVGGTTSVDFPTYATRPEQVERSWDTSLAPSLFPVPDVFVLELAPSGDHAVYATYLGGDGVDLPNAEGASFVSPHFSAGAYGGPRLAAHPIAVDGRGRAVVVGTTSSSDFPIAGGIEDQRSPPPFAMGFAAVLDANGALEYSTHLRGSHPGSEYETTYATAVAFDAPLTTATSVIYVAGHTNDRLFPGATPEGSIQALNGGGLDGFLVRIDPSRLRAASITYSTFFGGSGDERVVEIALDRGHRVHLVGETTSPDLPGVGETSFDETCGSDGRCNAPLTSGHVPADVFVARIDLDTPTGHVGWATYLGGQGDDRAGGLALDGTGAVYVTGSTPSADFPTTLGTIDPICADAGPDGVFYRDAFVTKLSPTGERLMYSTCLGGSQPDEALAIVVNGWAMATIAGATSSLDFPLQSPVLPRCGSDAYPFACAFVAKLDALGSALLHATTIGGPSLAPFEVDEATGLALGPDGALFVGGLAFDTRFPTTRGAFDVTCGNDRACDLVAEPWEYPTTDGFLLRLGSTEVPAVNMSPRSIVDFFRHVPLRQTATGDGDLRQVWLKNEGDAPLHVFAVQATGDFSVASACGATVLPRSGCGLAVRFTPTAPGRRTGTLVVTDDADGSPHVVPLEGTSDLAPSP